MDDRPLIFWGTTSENRAVVYARCDGPNGQSLDEHGGVLEGFVSGPYRPDGGTLASRTPLRFLGNQPNPMATATIVDPCYWAPGIPITYRMRLWQTRTDGEPPREWVLEFGLRSCRAERSSLYWSGKRWVFRGMNGPPVDQRWWRVAEQTRGGLAIATHDADVLGEATRRGVPVAIRAVSAEDLTTWRLAGVFPAVWTVLVGSDVGEVARRLQKTLAPNTLVSAAGLNPEEPCPPWADVQWRPLDDLRLAKPLQWGPQPAVIFGTKHDLIDVEQSRKQVDALQAMAARKGVFAGFSCCLPSHIAAAPSAVDKAHAREPSASDGKLAIARELPPPQPDSQLDRYARQMRYGPIGELGQRRLLDSRVLVCGCGALGSVLANTLARAGVGRLRLVDRDYLELSNLQRQVLYDEEDVASGLPKAIAAQRRLAKINSQIEIEAIVADVDHRNIGDLVQGVDLIVDGLDNFQTRYLLNDAAHRYGLPWIFGGCVGADGQTMTIIPGETACLRCLSPEAPPPGATATCDSVGILGPIVNIVASLQANEAIKILSGNRHAVSRCLTVIELWDNRIRQVSLEPLRATQACDACGGRAYPWLDGQYAEPSVVLCGRNAVQISAGEPTRLDLESLARRLEGLGEVTRNKHLLRFKTGDRQITVFPDARAIIAGTEDTAEARTLYTRYIGG